MEGDREGTLSFSDTTPLFIKLSSFCAWHFHVRSGSSPEEVASSVNKKKCGSKEVSSLISVGEIGA